MTVLKLTQIPLLNSIVIQQSDGHFFIAAKDSFIIDKDGLLQLLEELGNIGFITWQELEELGDNIYENTKNNSDSG